MVQDHVLERACGFESRLRHFFYFPGIRQTPKASFRGRAPRPDFIGVVQDHVLERACGFESRLRHCIFYHEDHEALPSPPLINL